MLIIGYEQHPAWVPGDGYPEFDSVQEEMTEQLGHKPEDYEVFEECDKRHAQKKAELEAERAWDDGYDW